MAIIPMEKKVQITKAGKLSQLEARKALRDAVIVAVGALIPEIMSILQVIDFGEYSMVASLTLAMLSPLVNRLLSIWRIS